MVLTAGARLGPYEILSALGAGGMGEVYRARDSRLQRTVAIKILPAHVSAHPDARARFEREAHALASLSHPNICAVYDVGRHDEVDFIVMECLEGQTLAARLERGGLPLDQTLKIAREIADALDKAHRRGITHRDLKPANIVLTAAGAKLLDFGLAKLTQASETPADMTSLPTNVAVTGEGTILGTLQYMAPEQLEGQEADARTDIFAFGALLYEMVTGRRAFEGKSQATLISAIMSASPRPLRELVQVTPRGLERIVERCLEKDPENRWQSARDLLLELVSVDRHTGDDPRPTQSRRPLAVAVVVSATAAALLAGVTVSLFESGAATPPAWSAAPIRFAISPPPDTTFYNGDFSIPFAVSPDGRQIAFLATAANGTRHLWVRPLDSDVARPVSGTEGATFPFWSPDSEWIGFAADNRLKKVRIAGGEPQILGALENPFKVGAAWGAGGDIVLQATALSGLSRISGQGGNVSTVTTVGPDHPERFHAWPQFLPDGRTFIYFEGNPGRVFLGSLDGASPRLLAELPDMSSLGYAPGYLLYVEDSVLYARPLDEGSLTMAGEPIRIADGVPTSGPGRAPFAVSANGVLAYSSNAVGDVALLQWFERDGRPGAVVAPAANYSGFSLSPDRGRLAFSRWDAGGRRDIWLRDLVRGAESRLTSDGDSMAPVWASQGTSVAFASARGKPPDVYVLDLDTGRGDREVTTGDDVDIPQDWSADGASILYSRQGATGLDLSIMHVDTGRTESLPLNTRFSEWQARLSPDGRWIAYVSDETGRNDVFVAEFPTGRGKRAVSTGGAVFPQWRADGRELFYVSDAQVLTAVSITTSSSALDVGPPAELFRIERPADVSGRPDASLYAVDATGRRFLIAVRAPASSAPPIQVIVNWPALLDQR